MPMAMEARKPIFSLNSADGAIGAHAEAVKFSGPETGTDLLFPNETGWHIESLLPKVV
jgi:hypothetical protein